MSSDKFQWSSGITFPFCSEGPPVANQALIGFISEILRKLQAIYHIKQNNRFPFLDPTDFLVRKYEHRGIFLKRETG